MLVYDRLIAFFKNFPHLKKMKWPNTSIHEVGPRDGMQYEPFIFPTPVKAAIIDELFQAKFPYIEITSFLAPRYAPTLADHRIIAEYKFKNKGNTNVGVFAPNPYTVDLASKTKADVISFMISACPELCKKNFNNKTIIESIEWFKETINLAKSFNLKVKGNIGFAFGSEFSNSIDPKFVNEYAERLIDQKCDYVCIQDNIAKAKPENVSNLMSNLKIDKQKLSFHFHDTEYFGIENCLTAISEGAKTIESSFGGLGRCPYAESRTGNNATEEIIFAFELLGIEHGVNYKHVTKATEMAENIMNAETVSEVKIEDFEDSLEMLKKKIKEQLDL